MELIYLYLLIAFVLIEVIMVKLGGWILPFITAIFGLSIVGYSLAYSTDIPFFPIPNLFLATISILVMYHSATKRGE